MRITHGIPFEICGGLWLAVFALSFGLTVPAFPQTPPRDALSLADEAARIAAVTTPATDFSRPEPYEARPGGAATGAADRSSFSQPLGNLRREQRLSFRLGEALFDKLWVQAPSSTQASDGLGPLFNARACASCHQGGGRGTVPSGPDEAPLGLVVRLMGPNGGDPVYGRQIQTRAAAGVAPEAHVSITWQPAAPIRLADGTQIPLRKPVLHLSDLAHGPLAPSTSADLRLAPPLIGLGLLEAIGEADIRTRADPADADGDGISGRAQVLGSTGGKPILGRFNWRADRASIAEQNAAALSTDLGLSNPIFPAYSGDCTPEQTRCLAAPDGGSVQHEGLELGQQAFALLRDYTARLAPPARRGLANPDVLRGKRIFYQSGCESCHRAKFVTERLAPDASGAVPPESFQLIWPYSDLLLHDMGEGLAGGDGAREWRTPPLWGIGLTQAVSGAHAFLHDGRAASLLEAILWHGGEAAPARDRVIALPSEDRAALLAFLRSL